MVPHDGAPYCSRMGKLTLLATPIFMDEHHNVTLYYGCHLCLGHKALDQKAHKIYSVGRWILGLLATVFSVGSKLTQDQLGRRLSMF